MIHLSSGQVLDIDEIQVFRPVERKDRIAPPHTDLVIVKGEVKPIPLLPDEARAIQAAMFKPRSVVK